MLHAAVVAGADLRHRLMLFRPLLAFLRTIGRPLIPLRISLRIHHTTNSSPIHSTRQQVILKIFS